MHRGCHPIALHDYDTAAALLHRRRLQPKKSEQKGEEGADELFKLHRQQLFGALTRRTVMLMHACAQAAGESMPYAMT